MSNELVKLEVDFTQQLVEFEKIQDICKKLMATKHYQQMGEAGVHAIIARAKSLGIHPFEALNSGFHCINGKIGMSTEMMAALVRKRGHSVTKDPKSNAEICILHGKRADNGDTWTCSFSRQDAESAGLWSSATWKKYPQIMLYNRTMSMLFRQLFPDLSLGAGYVEDELREITKTGDYQKDLPVAEIEVKEQPKLPTDAPIKKVTSEQANELSKLMLEMPFEFQETVFEWMKGEKYNTYADFTENHYKALMKRIEKEKEKPSEEVVDE